MEQVLKRLIDQKGVDSEYGISVEVQEKLRQEGQSAPWMKIGRKVYYVRKEWERWLQEQPDKTAASGGPSADARAPLTLGDNSLAKMLAEIIRTTPMGEETRKRVAELLGGDTNEG